MVLVSVNNATELTSSSKRGVLDPVTVSTKITRDERREPTDSNDEDSDSDDSAYADFLAMLGSPSNKKEVVVEASAVAVVEPVKAKPVAKKPVVNKKPVKSPAITGGTSFAAMAPTPQKKTAPSPVQTNASTKASSWGVYVEEEVEEDSDSEDSDYADFLTMLSSPTSKKEVVVEAKAVVQPVKAMPVAVARKETAKAVKKPMSAPIVAPKPEKKQVPAKRQTTASTMAVSESSESSEESSEESDWSSEEDEEEDEIAAAPMMKAKSLGRGTMSFDANDEPSVDSIEEISTPKAASARRSSVATPKAAPKPIPARAASTRVAATRPVEPKFDLPRSASVATLHFAKQQIKQAEDMETMRSVVKDQEPVEPLPFDHFTKLGEAETEAKAKEAWELAEANMPIGISYFTAKAEEEKAVREAEQRELSQQEMSAAARHFAEVEAEKKVKAAQAQAGAAENMPAAIQHFTVADRAEKDKKRQSIQEMRENPPAMSPGQEYFTMQDRAEKEKKRQEIQDMIENPPVASVATEHFNKVHSVRKLEIEAIANEPAPRAIEYFTQKANEEKSKRDLMLTEAPPEPSLATQHFAEQEKKKVEEMEANRSQIRQTSDVEPLPVDYFTKLGEAEIEAKAKEARELSESHMPVGISYFTAKAEEDRIVRETEQRELSQQEMSAAARHFAEVEAEKKAKAAEALIEEAEVMPAAIQHFTVADRAEKEKKRQSIAAMKENPPAMAPGQEYFTMHDRAEKEKKRQEIQDMIENPPAASVATEHFNKVHSARKLEIEAIANEPAPRAIEYFTQKANEEKSKRDLMSNEAPDEPSLATQHFADQEKNKAEEMEAQRVLLRQKAREGSSQRAQVDWQALTKQQAPQVPAF